MSYKRKTADVIHLCDLGYHAGLTPLVVEGRDCPNAAQHTPSPAGYGAWHEWAKIMAKTHSQEVCAGCNKWMTWVGKDQPVHVSD